jgi:hypothetical protein
MEHRVQLSKEDAFRLKEERLSTQHE